MFRLEFLMPLVVIVTSMLLSVFFFFAYSPQREDFSDAVVNKGSETVRESLSEPRKTPRSPDQTRQADSGGSRQTFFSGEASHWKLQEVNGRPSSLSGGRLKMESLDAERIAEKAKETMTAFGFGNSTLSDRAEPVGGRRSQGVQAYLVQHLYEGYPVYGSRMRVMVDHRSNEILSFNINEMREIQGRLPQQTGDVESLRSRVREINPEAQLIDQKGLFVAADGNGSARLVYQVRSTPEDTYRPDTEIWLLDAQTGQVLEKNSIVIADEYKRLE